ncbi:hypothetical protein VOLCADRAFT_120136 [Volvox carteri f. nagariensis]|uniref:Uncharacterized protein n=1 Tax=Volvox carteri f. nagariensis TaxID=3068 RepID=D8TH26_VOLCA|nr:uncharacterized protein VOLCADRAFT_120136 [Volvox carteri f. nagariensis]EFJ53000.1 hypothetical protein VOLCADRAFT_120136 [Volvox carteri f. nagariensis]|eukprot:XP_002946005.1 hypothetical protein VOLCADRAFT_120136 [Volvox carteri f. nagariensis]
MADVDNQAGPGPRSWAEDVKTYRMSRGSRSFSTILGAEVPARYCRTNYVPFCDTRHPLFPYNDFIDGKGSVRIDPTITADRYTRHGWGDTSLLKEEGEPGPARRRTISAHVQGKARPPSPHGADGRTNLTGVLQMTEAGGVDTWIGNPLVHPSAGKRVVRPPADPKGRRDLFDVIHCRAPGAPSDDAWLGHKLIDPARGRVVPPGPEQLRGRADLRDIFSMSILTDPRRLELLQKGADPLGDAWCGNKLIDPAKGRRALHSSPAAVQVLHGSTFRPEAFDKAVPPPYCDLPPHATAAAVISGQAPPIDDLGPMGKKTFPELPAPNRFDGRRDLYAHMTYKPLTGDEQAKYRRAFDDTGIHGRRVVPVPGSDDPAKGPDMLQWKPEARVAQFVPRGGLAQEGRIKASKLRGAKGR